METRTYYDILGISSEATFEEITNAKNALAKVYHPDANMDTEIDTTFYMQEILEAYHTLSDPEKRREYNNLLTESPNRVFRTYTVKNMEQEEYTLPSFVTYWNAACKLHEIVFQSESLLEISVKKENLLLKLFKKLIRRNGRQAKVTAQLNDLSLEAIEYIALLKTSEIPMNYWQPEAMNWVLIRWGKKQSMDYLVLFSKYETYVKQETSALERSKLRAKNRHFQNSLKKLLHYASEY